MLENLIIRYILEFNLISLLEIINLACLCLGSLIFIKKEENIKISSTSTLLFVGSLLLMLVIFSIKEEEALIYMIFAVLFGLFYYLRKNSTKEEKKDSLIFILSVLAVSLMVVVFINPSVRSTEDSMVFELLLFATYLFFYIESDKKKNIKYLILFVLFFAAISIIVVKGFLFISFQIFLFAFVAFLRVFEDQIKAEKKIIYLDLIKSISPVRSKIEKIKELEKENPSNKMERVELYA